MDRDKFSRLLLSKKSLALLTSLVAASNIASSFGLEKAEAPKIYTTKFDANIPITSMDYSEYQRKVVTDNAGQPTFTQVMASILEDARGPCLGMSRCALALTDNDLLTLEDRFKSLNLEPDKVGDYAVSVSGNLAKARALAIIENKESDFFYVHYVLNNFIELKKAEMAEQGLMEEAKIADNAIIADIGQYTALAMNPHAEQSMDVIIHGMRRFGK